MAMSFGRFLARNILTLTKSNPLPLCRIHAVNRFIDNPFKAAAIGIRLQSTGTSSKAKTTTAGAKRAVKKPTTARKTAVKATSSAGRTATKAKSAAAKKKPAAKKPAAKKKLAAKKKKPAAKKKKPAAKKKKIVKQLTPEQLERKKKRSLGERVLEAPKIPVANPYTTFVALGGGAVGTEAAEKWKALTPEQQQEYAQKARDLREAGIRDREQWVKSKSPQEVYKANRARRHLRLLGGKGGKVSVLEDPRIPKRPVPVTAAFLRDQWNAGTFTNPDGTKTDIVTAMRRSRDLYEKLSAAEKKAYEDQYAVDRVAYKKARDELLGDLKKLYKRL